MTSLHASSAPLAGPAPIAHAALLKATFAALALVLAWDWSGLDIAMAEWFGGPAGFPLRNHWLLSTVMHEGGRIAGWALALALCVGVWWPFGALRRIDTPRRLQWAATTLAAVLLVSLLKSVSPTSCPAELSIFGRSARYLSHWLWQSDGGGGHCFPAGHASAGFAFMSGYFAFLRDDPVRARRWLLGASAAGLLLGLAQQARGAHFMSHTLWTGWLCWTVALAGDWIAQRHRLATTGARGANA